MSSSWWRHQREIFSALLAICRETSSVTGEFPSQRPVTRSFDIFFDLHLNKWLNKQSCGWWFDTPSCLLWHHCDVNFELNSNWNPARVLGVHDTEEGWHRLENVWYSGISLRWRHNERDAVSNHQLHDCLPKRLLRRRSKNPSKLPVTGLCGGNSPVTVEFPAQRASNAEDVSIWWRHHVHGKSKKLQSGADNMGSKLVQVFFRIRC